ncbi:HSP20-like chaperone [Lentinula raphanica]|uniref:HSP20-like chaperone n=1 Tax=Lentinula raphanica TaxID=153919 RepID=A0AA38P8Y5_9AGAR|nr:HSP20-like chaperone [Lentinula raphanica]KAJ3838346.1 HSP20-like chaperone [Lentinula raphanica]KAJ3974980.1 HSP20-like chaperone [Lentinula raphanica]
MSLYFYEPGYHWDRFFDNAFGTLSPRGGNQGQAQTPNTDVPRFLRPKMDLHENKEQNVVTATFEFPGVKKEDVQLDFHNGRLTVAAETKLSEEREQDGYAVRERSFGKFSRTLQLPQGVKEEEIKATMENGVLTVTFPKATAEQTPKKITIS